MKIKSEQIKNIVKLQNEKNEFSGIIHIQKNKKTIFENGYGYANKSELIINKVDTKFGVASGGKFFTAIAICQLVEKGLLSFDSLLKDCIDIPFPKFDSSNTKHFSGKHSNLSHTFKNISGSGFDFSISSPHNI